MFKFHCQNEKQQRRREQDRDYKRERRGNENATDRRKRLKKQRSRDRKKIANEAPAEKIARRKVKAEQQRLRRAKKKNKTKNQTATDMVADANDISSCLFCSDPAPTDVKTVEGYNFHSECMEFWLRLSNLQNHLKNNKTLGCKVAIEEETSELQKVKCVVCKKQDLIENLMECEFCDELIHEQCYDDGRHCEPKDTDSDEESVYEPPEKKQERDRIESKKSVFFIYFCHCQTQTYQLLCFVENLN